MARDLCPPGIRPDNRIVIPGIAPIADITTPDAPEGPAPGVKPAACKGNVCPVPAVVTPAPPKLPPAPEMKAALAPQIILQPKIDFNPILADEREQERKATTVNHKYQMEALQAQYKAQLESVEKSSARQIEMLREQTAAAQRLCVGC